MEDTYSIGALVFSLPTGGWPTSDESTKDVNEAIRCGFVVSHTPKTKHWERNRYCDWCYQKKEPFVEVVRHRKYNSVTLDMLPMHSDLEQIYLSQEGGEIASALMQEFTYRISGKIELIVGKCTVCGRRVSKEESYLVARALYWIAKHYYTADPNSFYRPRKAIRASRKG